MPSREELQQRLAELRESYRVGSISLTQYRLRSARLVDRLEQAKARRPRYAIT